MRSIDPYTVVQPIENYIKCSEVCKTIPKNRRKLSDRLERPPRACDYLPGSATTSGGGIVATTIYIVVVESD